MAQPPPLLLKHPVAPSPTPNVAQTTNGAATGAQFIPRREFIRDHRIASSFSLLALSGSGFVRLYSFSATVIAALRRLFDHRKLVSSVREHAPKQFYEFSLEGKPWSNAKSITAEKLIIDILTIILHCGYIFLSTIDYGREPDDKLAIVFSKPQMAQNPLFPLSNGSAVSLNPPVIKTPFAISFSSATQLRVVGPPLHSTPAVLQAVRGAWPRGVVSEKKVGDATYEFKLKGYKWFQEDTFATDSLHHILGLLSALDTHGFTLLTSLSLSSRSRMKDLWIFTGDHHDSPPLTPTASNTDLRREITPQQYNVVPGPSPLSLGAEKRTSPPRNAPGMETAESEYRHRRYSSDPVTSSPLKPTRGQTTLHKPSPKTQFPLAFVPEYAQPSIPYPTGLAPSPPPTGRIVRSVSNPSSIGSLDMTGVGSGLRKSIDMQRAPSVLYAVDGRQQEHSSFFARRPSAEAPQAPFLKSDSRRASADSKADSRHSSRPSYISRSSTLPLPAARELSPSPIGPKIQVHAPSPIKAKSSGHALINGHSSYGSRRDEKDLSGERPTNTPAPVNPTPTPPLLTPGTFEVRDSAYSSATRWTQEFPWVGRELLSDRDRTRRDDPDALHLSARKNDMELRSIQRARGERRDDVAQKNVPQTIREQPGLQGNGHAHPADMDKTHHHERTRQGEVRDRSPELRHAQQRRRSDSGAAALSNGQERPYREKSPSNGTPPPDRAVHAPKPQATRRDTAMSGWVMVNVEPQEKKKASSHSPPPVRPGVRQHRSNSDSRLLRPDTRSPVGNAPATATMSAAAKTIAMIDAVDARERENEKSSAGGLKRIFHRSKGSDGEKNSSGKRRAPEGGVAKNRSLDQEERDERKEKTKTRGHAPQVAKPTEKRYINLD